MPARARPRGAHPPSTFPFLCLPGGRLRYATLSLPLPRMLLLLKAVSPPSGERQPRHEPAISAAAAASSLLLLLR